MRRAAEFLQGSLRTAASSTGTAIEQPLPDWAAVLQAAHPRSAVLLLAPALQPSRSRLCAAPEIATGRVTGRHRRLTVRQSCRPSDADDA